MCLKIHRLIGILNVLLQKEKVTAPYLADKFEVSRRTINRDIEDLCMAGLPIVTIQGVNGGITIQEEFKIDKTLFTNEEIKSIFTGLNSLDSISDTPHYKQIINKFSCYNDNFINGNDILIDLSSHYKNSLSPKISLIRHAIKSSRVIEFDYFNHLGEQKRFIEPYMVVFQWKSWYVFGFCLKSKDFRLFKLNRLWNLSDTNEEFVSRDISPKKLEFNNYFSDEIKLVAIFDKSEKYRLIEEYGVDCFSYTADKKLYFEFPFTNMDYLLRWILSFGDKVEVIEPKELIEELKCQAEKILKYYK
jgi:predicted DNA-binding transcriptional regulator YafY